MAFLSSLFKSRSKIRETETPGAPVPEGYSAYTREFDQVIQAKDLPGILKSAPDRPDIRFELAMQNFNRRFQHERLEIYEAAAPLIRKLVQQYSPDRREQSVVSFLIDHSGSMKGMRIISALVAVECAVSILGQCNISTEVLGFTTRNWRGGEARKKWKRAGSPRNPGRLCDLRHIVYKAADDHGLSYLQYAFHPDLLKENIDGEALEWAASRIASKKWKNRVVCFLSDGAPVDDSTLLSNENQRLLLDHLLLTEEQLRQQGIRIGHLLLAGDMNYRDFDNFEVAHEPETAGKALINVVMRLLLPGDAEELKAR